MEWMFTIENFAHLKIWLLCADLAVVCRFQAVKLLNGLCEKFLR